MYPYVTNNHYNYTAPPPPQVVGSMDVPSKMVIDLKQSEGVQ